MKNAKRIVSLVFSAVLLLSSVMPVIALNKPIYTKDDCFYTEQEKENIQKAEELYGITVQEPDLEEIPVYDFETGQFVNWNYLSKDAFSLCSEYPSQKVSDTRFFGDFRKDFQKLKMIEQNVTKYKHYLGGLGVSDLTPISGVYASNAMYLRETFIIPTNIELEKYGYKNIRQEVYPTFSFDESSVTYSVTSDDFETEEGFYQYCYDLMNEYLAEMNFQGTASEIAKIINSNPIGDSGWRDGYHTDRDFKGVADAIQKVGNNKPLFDYLFSYDSAIYNSKTIDGTFVNCYIAAGTKMVPDDDTYENWHEVKRFVFYQGIHVDTNYYIVEKYAFNDKTNQYELFFRTDEDDFMAMYKQHLEVGSHITVLPKQSEIPYFDQGNKLNQLGVKIVSTTAAPVIVKMYFNQPTEKNIFSAEIETDGNGTASAVIDTKYDSIQIEANKQNGYNEYYNGIAGMTGMYGVCSVTAAEGYEFDKWESNVNIENNEFAIQPGEDVTIKAIFKEVNKPGPTPDPEPPTPTPDPEPQPPAPQPDPEPEKEYKFTLSTDGNGTASAAFNMETLAASVINAVSGNKYSVSTSLLKDTSIKLSYKANEGYEFDRWEANITISDNMKMPEKDVTVKAIFKKVTPPAPDPVPPTPQPDPVIPKPEVKKAKITLSTDGNGTASLFTEIKGINSGASGMLVGEQNNYTETMDAIVGYDINLSYKANAGYEFDRWEANVEITDDLKVTEKDMTFKAIFKKIEEKPVPADPQPTEPTVPDTKPTEPAVISDPKEVKQINIAVPIIAGSLVFCAVPFFFLFLFFKRNKEWYKMLKKWYDESDTEFRDKFIAVLRIPQGMLDSFHNFRQYKRDVLNVYYTLSVMKISHDDTVDMDTGSISDIKTVVIDEQERMEDILAENEKDEFLVDFVSEQEYWDTIEQYKIERNDVNKVYEFYVELMK